MHRTCECPLGVIHRTNFIDLAKDLVSGYDTTSANMGMLAIIIAEWSIGNPGKGLRESI